LIRKQSANPKTFYAEFWRYTLKYESLNLKATETEP